MPAHEKQTIHRKSIKVATRINHGGLADIYDAFNRHGDRVVLRELRRDQRFKWRIRKCFRKGIQVRRELGSHPHIVQYQGEGGLLQPFEVLEYVGSSNLKQLIFKRAHAVREHPVCILQQVAEAMALVHAKGWLHLDIKPENILVLTSGERPHIKLTDFDLCQPMNKDRAPRLAGGSLAYLPPEFLRNKEISISTDVFAFGVMTYYLFTTQMPFVGSVSANMERGNYEIKFPETQDGVVPECVQAFICRCLAPMPMHRFCDDNELRIGLKVLARELLASQGTARNSRQDYQ